MSMKETVQEFEANINDETRSQNENEIEVQDEGLQESNELLIASGSKKEVGEKDKSQDAIQNEETDNILIRSEENRGSRKEVGETDKSQDAIQNEETDNELSAKDTSEESAQSETIDTEEDTNEAELTEREEISDDTLEVVHILHPDTTLVDITQIEPVLEVESDYGIFGKTMYAFPPLVDPGLDDALYNTAVPILTYDEVGVELYKDLCKEFDVVPIARFIDSLHGDTVDLKNYGLNPHGMKALARALHRNRTVQTVNLQGNWLTKSAVFHLGEMLRENNTITSLNLSGCRIGIKGAMMIKEGLSLTQRLKELDLSWNYLEDDGIEAISPALAENYTIKKLNLSHNELGSGAGIFLGSVLEENWALEHLDLSHNKLFPKDGLKALFAGLSKSKSVTHLNMSWNALSTKFAGMPIRAYLKESEVIQYLDLSWNRLEGQAVRMIKNGVLKSTSLLQLKLGNNPLLPEDANSFLKSFVIPTLPLLELNFDDIWVNKDFLETKEKVLKVKDLKVTIGGVYSNYTIKGPDTKQLLLARAKYEAQKPKSMKKKKDLGHFMLKLEDKMMRKEKFTNMVNDEKLKISENLVEEIMKNFEGPKKLVDLKAMREYYLQLYPDTEPPPPKQKKKEKGKGKKVKKEESKVTEISEEKPPSLEIRKKPEVQDTAEQSKIDIKIASKLLGSHASAAQFLTESSRSATNLAMKLSSGKMLYHEAEMNKPKESSNVQFT